MLANIERPRTLNDVVGQDSIVKTLKGYIKNNKIPNVMFFIGQSGAGKNTLANIIASTIVCDHPVKEEDGSYSPCLTCPSCQDIIQEKFQKSVSVYNGSDITADAIRKIENDLDFISLDNKPKVMIVNESQLVKEMRRLLEIIERERSNVYFIFTSTDRTKFSSPNGKNNKDQEIQALRGRGAYFDIKPISTSVIQEYLFNLLEKNDPEGKIPDIFLTEGLSVIAENANNNLRLAINDFNQALMGELYDSESLRSLLGYQDEKENTTILYNLSIKNKNIMTTLSSLDLSTFFVYSWKILSSITIQSLTGGTSKEAWQDKLSKGIIASGNFDKLLEVYSKTNELCNGYFSDNVFLSNLYQYMKTGDSAPKQTIKEESPVVKKVKIKKVS